MEFKFGKITFSTARVVKYYVLILAISVIGLGFLLPNKLASALDSNPVCLNGGIHGGGINSTFQIILNCSNIDHFSHSGSTEADSLDLIGIRLRPADKNIQPFRATINADRLVLDFYVDFNDPQGTRDRTVIIDSGKLVSGTGIFNQQAIIVTSEIADYAIPNIVDDYYELSGMQLDVPADFGVLANDTDAETLVQNAIIETNPEHGHLMLELDGSFTYIPDGSLNQIDTFTYRASDLSGNSSSARVIVSDAAPIITAEIHRSGPILNNTYSKVGDTVRLDFQSNEPIIVDTVIISKHIVTDIFSGDNLRFYALYRMQPDDIEGMNLYSITAHDSAGNVSTITSEEGVIFDKTAPDVSIDDLDDGTVGDVVVITGTIDDYTSYLSLGIDGKGKFVPTIDTDGQNWTYVYDTARLSPGNHTIKIIAADLSGNFSQYSTNLKLKKNPHNNNFVEPESVIRRLDTISPSVAIQPPSYKQEILGAQSLPSADEKKSLIMTKESNEKNTVDFWYGWLLIPAVGILIGMFIRRRFIS